MNIYVLQWLYFNQLESIGALNGPCSDSHRCSECGPKKIDLFGGICVFIHDCTNKNEHGFGRCTEK